MRFDCKANGLAAYVQPSLFIRIFSKRLLLLGHFFLIDKLIGVQGACQLPEYSSRKACDEEANSDSIACRRRSKYIRSGETLNGAKRQCGSPHAPRKASILERKSTTFKGNKFYENSLNKKETDSRESVSFVLYSPVSVFK
jgi:hypothetical protein